MLCIHLTLGLNCLHVAIQFQLYEISAYYISRGMVCSVHCQCVVCRCNIVVSVKTNVAICFMLMCNAKLSKTGCTFIMLILCTWLVIVAVT